jgi:hypothetical protein
MPVGLWVRSIAVSTLLTFCPPAPPERAVDRVMSSFLISIVTSSTSGITATVAVLVCTRPAVSVAGTRWTRCTPASNLSLEKTESPFTSSVASRYPPASESVADASRTDHPCVSAYLV